MREACHFSSLVFSPSVVFLSFLFFPFPPRRLSVFAGDLRKHGVNKAAALLISPRTSLGGRRSEFKMPPPHPHLTATTTPPSLSMAAWPPLIMHSLSIDGGTYSVAQCQATIQLRRCNCCVETLSCSISSLARSLRLSLSLARLTRPPPHAPHWPLVAL